MGSLKDEMRGIREDHKPCEKADNGGHPGSSDGSDVPGQAQINRSHESTSHGDYKPGPFMDASSTEERDKTPISTEQELSGGMCDDTGQSDSTLAVTIRLKQQPDAYKTISITHDDDIISSKVMRDEDGENQGYEDKNMDPEKGKEAGKENILLAPVPSTPAPPSPWSPAPVGQHHMRTQVSLEVVQCQSAATSPMTPPEDGHSFFFPGTFLISGTAGAELQVGKQVGFCSVATSPMTPKSPSYTAAFPELTGRETVQREEKVKESVGQWKSGQQGSSAVEQSPEEAETEIKEDRKFTTSTELSEGFTSNASAESFVSCPAAELTDSQVTQKNGKQQCKQRKMGSMDQDITIMVTLYNNNEEEESTFYPTETEMVKIDKYEEHGGGDNDEEREEGRENISTQIVAPDHVQDTSTTTRSGGQPEEGSVSACDKARTDCENSEVTENRGWSVETSDVSVTKPPPPESPAPFGCHNIRTQVSLEVVQCQSVATSPMTPPDGDHAFSFPCSSGRCAAACAETKDAELQVGQQVEFRSVATAPMTPRTPAAVAFPGIKKDTGEEQKIGEGKEDMEEKAVEDKEEEVKEEEEVPEQKRMASTEDKEGVAKEEEEVPEQKRMAATEDKEGVAKEEEEVPEQKRMAATEDKEGVAKEEEEVPEEGKVAPTEEDTKEARNCKDKVEDVSWDEKGMTWEVYGAVVEVTVLGSAIQKHLEKQVKKRQPSMPPPPPLRPTAIPLPSESILGGSTKGRAGKRREQDGEVSRRRRNPFRLMMENMQQPHCCSRAHTTE